MGCELDNKCESSYDLQNTVLDKNGTALILMMKRKSRKIDSSKWPGFAYRTKSTNIKHNVILSEITIQHF